MAKILVDTGPLLAAIDTRDTAHDMAAPILARLRREAVVPTPVLVEVDHLISERAGYAAARSFSKATLFGEREIAFLTGDLCKRAVEFDHQYADLNLGFVDSCVMAIAERHELPILTFDFADFRATESAAGPWRLAVDEYIYQRAVAQ